MKHPLFTLQTSRFMTPHVDIQRDMQRIYKKNDFKLGWPKRASRMYSHISRPNTVAIVGIALGDEGKGRLVDNTLEELLKRKTIANVAVIRFQGGNNAGHTVEKGTITLALHVVPSGVLHTQSLGIIDRGVVVHPEDLKTEVEYVEDALGPLKNSLFLSNEAILCTDLERAEEVLNRLKDGKSKGGTGRGISPAYAHHYDRLGLKLYDLLRDDWKEKLSTYYDRYEKELASFGLPIAEVDIPDFATTVLSQKAAVRKVGSKRTFLSRLEDARQWLVMRKFVTNTFPLHQKLYSDSKTAVLFEGAQAAGLDAWIGTRPDVTSSNTTVYGVRDGTAFWRLEDIDERIGVFKIPYTSSVGQRKMPTHVDLQLTTTSNQSTTNNKPRITKDQQWALWVRETAHEYGTTTGRPRDINHLDLAMLSYNARMAGVEALAGTHLDVSKENQDIKVCTHYEDAEGKYIPYQPGLLYQSGIHPHYVTLPGWNGEACRKAKKRSDVPKTALQFLAFIQARTGFPIISVTTGKDRKHILSL